MWKEFRDFIARGNVMDLAIGVIIGAAFGKIVATLVEGILMPPIGLALGRIDFSSLFYVLDSAKGIPVSIADAKAKGDSGHRLRPAAQRHRQFPDRGGRGLRDGEAGEPDQELGQSRRGRRSHHQGVPLLRLDDFDQSQPVPAVHLAALGSAMTSRQAIAVRLVLAVLITGAVLTPALAQPVPAGRSSDARAGDADTAARPKVRLIATGGTISNRTGGRLTADELLKSAPALDRYVRAEAEQFANVASSELTLTQWLELARRINEVFKQDSDLAGVVVTSGTDTLEETAYFLNLTVRTDKPVVVVGSMRNPSTLGYEGAANLLEGFRVAAEPASRGKGVLVVLNDEINAAREVTKTDALRLQTFQSRGYGVLGVVDSDRVVYYRTGVKRHTAASEFDVASLKELPRVDVDHGVPGGERRPDQGRGRSGGEGHRDRVGRRRRHERHAARRHPVRGRQGRVRRHQHPDGERPDRRRTAWPRAAPPPRRPTGSRRRISRRSRRASC